MNSVDRDGPRLVTLGARDEECQDAIANFRLDAVRIDPNGQCDRSIEGACDPLAPVHTDLFAVVDRLLAGDADGAATNARSHSCRRRSGVVG